MSDADEHFPWQYTEYGVLCICGEPMDRNEVCCTERNNVGGTGA